MPAMLRDGPTPANVGAAAMVGLLPFAQPWNPLGPISRTFHRAGLSPLEIPFPLVPLGDCPLDDEQGRNIVDGATDGAELANALQLPFKDGLLQMLGGAVGDAGVDAVNEQTGNCTTPLDLPQPPRPPDPPGFFEQALDDVLDTGGDVLNAGGDVGQWVWDGIGAGNDALDQVLEDLAYEIENSPWLGGGGVPGRRFGPN